MKKLLYSLFSSITIIAILGLINPLHAQKYCYPKFAAGGCNGNNISAFSLSNVNVTPSCNSASAVDTSALTGTAITVYRGKTYQINVSTDYSLGTNYAVWIDYQKDGNFEDIGDYVASEINGSFPTMTQNITIPLNATPVTTRLRVEIANGTPTAIAGATNYNTDCASFPTGYVGGSEDYKLIITAYSKDIGILALTPAYCPNKKEPVQVIIQNIGLNSLNGIPFTFKVGSTTVNSTYTRTLASNTQDTFTIGTFDASVAGTYKLQVYANLTGDGDRSNDTINTSLNIAQPAAPIISASTNHCGPGAVYLDAISTTAKSSTYWFTSDTGAVIYKKNIDSIRTPFLPIGASDTFYAESRFDTRDTLTKGTFSTAHLNYGGTMCDVFAKNTVIIDSLDVNFDETTADSCGVWMKIGTHNGYQNDQTAWTHIATVAVTPGGAGAPTHVRLPRPVTLQVGTLYGLYTYATSFADVNAYDVTYLSENPRANADLIITAGNSMGTVNNKPFTGGITNGRDWDGRIYYHLNACPSPRLPVSITMLQNPNGAYLAKSTPFGGKYNLGDEVHADQICVGDTNTYTIEPPTGMGQSDYGTKWVVNSINISTVRGTVLPNAVTTMPTTSAAGSIQIYPSATYGDSVFVMSVDMQTPATKCDSVIQRFVTVSSTPVADFSFTNPCGNVAVDITDLSTVKSKIDTIKTWTWDFGDGTTTNLNRKTPYPHLYATTGTYKVSLSVTSSPGCPASVTKTLVEYPVPVAKFGTKLACNTRPISFIDSSTIATGGKVVGWDWSFGDKTTGAVQDPIHTYPLSGPYSVKEVVTSDNGCKDSLTKTVRVNPLPYDKPVTPPKPIFSYNDKCVGSTIYMSTNIEDSSNAPVLNWNYGDGTAPGATPSHAYTKNGTYTITLIIKAGNGCIDTFTRPITPYAQPIPKITSVTKCAGQSVRFVDSSGSGNSATYNWHFGDGDSTINVDSPEVYHTYSKSSTYLLTLRIVSGQSCTGTGTGSVFVAPYPKASFTAAAVCIGNTTVFNNTSTGITAPGGYIWNFGDTTSLSSLPTPTHTYSNVGQYSARLYAVNRYGCADSDSITVSVNPLPAIAKWNTKEHNLQFKFLPADTTIGTFKWFFGDPANDSSSQWRPVFIYPATSDGKYQVVKLYVTNSFGCVSERTDSVLVEKSGIEVTGTTFDGITVFPNPFEGTTNITYTLPSRSNVNVSVYNAEGKLVAKLKDGMYGAGSYTDAFDGKKYNAADGVYYLKMYINDRYYTTKIINLK